SQPRRGPRSRRAAYMQNGRRVRYRCRARASVLCGHGGARLRPLVRTALDPACVITQDPALAWGGRHVGHDGFANFGLTLSSTLDSTVAIDAVFEADGDVIQFGHTRGTVRANGARFDIPEVHRWTVRDGKAVAAHSPSTLPRCSTRWADDE